MEIVIRAISKDQDEHGLEVTMKLQRNDEITITKDDVEVRKILDYGYVENYSLSDDTLKEVKIVI